jgi:hypothetical protein
MTTGSPQDIGKVRTIQLSASRVQAVLPSVDPVPTGEPTASSGPGCRYLWAKLWFRRSLLDVEYQLIGRGRVNARWIEARLHGQLWRLRLRALFRRGRRNSVLRGARLKMAPAEPFS